MRIVLTLFLAACSGLLSIQAEEITIDLLSGSGLVHFQPTTHWQRVERAIAVPDRMELSTRGNSGEVLVNSLHKDISIPCLLTCQSFGDVRVELEFMIPQGSNAGVYLMGRYEVQILDSFSKEKVGSGDLGGIYAVWDRSKPKGQQWWGGTRPLKNAAKAPGQWQRMEIIFRAPQFDTQGKKIADARFESVQINGQLVQQDATCTDPTASHPLPGEVPSGPIAIQGDHGPIAIRHFTATPLDSPATQAMHEIEAYWQEVERCVHEGDFQAYRATIHPDAVIVAGAKQICYPLRQALIRWESDFENTRSGTRKGDVNFRFSHRHFDDSTAHVSGIFRYTSSPNEGSPMIDYILFEALLTKKDGRWLLMMENQIGPATAEDWGALPE